MAQEEESNKVESSIRHRLNTKSTAKGIITFDITVEGTNVPLEEIKRLHDGLHRYMLQEYGLGSE